MTRPIYGITVLQYEDGSVWVRPSVYLDSSTGFVHAPDEWEKKHALLIEACGVVKREAGVVHSGVDDE